MLATQPYANQGLDCNTQDPACGVPTNTSLLIRLDRFIDPATAIRQSVIVDRGTDPTLILSSPEYDVVERVLIYRLGTLLPMATYTVEILIPTEDAPDGLRAFDGAPLAQGPVPLRFDFHTNGVAAPPDPVPSEPAPSCDDLVDTVFGQSSGCAGRSCHVANSAGEDPECDPGFGLAPGGDCVGVPRMGLWLAAKHGLSSTAIGRVAHETETGSKGGITLENPARFGVQMPIIDPGRPDNSYLLYKLLRNPGNYDANADLLAIDDPCATRYTDLGPSDACADPGADERTRLREWFVRGDPMPPDRHISRDDLRKIQAWIRAGAKCAP